ncbi:MAG: tetratricopeptide repeat protein, partial [Candidatus Velthaea sp.]
LLRRRTSSAAPNDERVMLASLCSLGRRLWRRRNAASLAAAMDAYERCLAIDPAYAPAHAGIADVHLTAAVYVNASARIAFGHARTSIAQALEIQPDLVEAHVAAADLSFFGDRNARKALETVTRIVNFAPANATVRNNAAWYALIYGDFATALAHIDALFALDPGGIEPQLLLAMSHIYRGEPEKAIALMSSMLELEPDSEIVRYRLGPRADPCRPVRGRPRLARAVQRV